MPKIGDLITRRTDETQIWVVTHIYHRHYTLQNINTQTTRKFHESTIQWYFRQLA